MLTQCLVCTLSAPRFFPYNSPSHPKLILQQLFKFSHPALRTVTCPRRLPASPAFHSLFFCHVTSSWNAQRPGVEVIYSFGSISPFHWVPFAPMALCSSEMGPLSGTRVRLSRVEAQVVCHSSPCPHGFCDQQSRGSRLFSHWRVAPG